MGNNGSPETPGPAPQPEERTSDNDVTVRIFNDALTLLLNLAGVWQLTPARPISVSNRFVRITVSAPTLVQPVRGALGAMKAPR